MIDNKEKNEPIILKSYETEAELKTLYATCRFKLRYSEEVRPSEEIQEKSLDDLKKQRNRLIEWIWKYGPRVYTGYKILRDHWEPTIQPILQMLGIL